MSLRARLTVMSALIVGTILALGSVLAFVVMREQLRGQVDEQLQDQAALVQQLSARRPLLPSPPLRLPATRAGSAPFFQVVRADGSTFGPQDSRLPVTRSDLAVARGQRDELLGDRSGDGRHLRVMTVPVNGGAVVLARPLADVDSALSQLRLVLAVLTAGGIGLAALVSRLFSRRVLAPIENLTRATEHIEATGDLDRRVDDRRTDEVGRLASSFNAMLARLKTAQQALGESAAAQRQLIADASHELRTPVASLRTNIEVLLSGRGLDEEAQRALMADVVEQLEELSALVGDLIELARGDHQRGDVEDLDLADIAQAALARAARHAPQVQYAGDLQPWPMTGSRERLGRAINNLLDNAAKFSPSGSTVHMVLRDGRLTVRDEGPGVAEDELPHIFDRFYRARDASRHQGSGLGLAIVQQVVVDHGGEISARTANGSGLEVTISFPA